MCTVLQGSMNYQYEKKRIQWPQNSQALSLLLQCTLEFLKSRMMIDLRACYHWRYSVVVSLHMAVEISRLGKSEIADFTAVRFFPAVDSLVFGEGRGISECLATIVTPVWPFTRVGPQVGGHRGTLWEPLLANWAAKWFLSAMGAQMGCQVCCLGEGLCTNVTAVRLLPTVCSHVGLESGGSCIALATDLADVVPRLGCRLWSRLGAGRPLCHCVDLSSYGGGCCITYSPVIVVHEDRLDICWVSVILHARACAIDRLTWSICTTHAQGWYQVCAMLITITPHYGHTSGRHGSWCWTLRGRVPRTWLVVVEGKKGSHSLPLLLFGYNRPANQRGKGMTFNWHNYE